jgi:hypothetical protein
MSLPDWTTLFALPISEAPSLPLILASVPEAGFGPWLKRPNASIAQHIALAIANLTRTKGQSAEKKRPDEKEPGADEFRFSFETPGAIPDGHDPRRKRGIV